MELFLFKKIATLYLDSCRGHFRRMMLLSPAYKFLIWVWSRYYICSFKIATLSNSTRCKLAHQQSQYPLGAGTTLPVFDSGCSEVVLSPALLVKFPLVHWMLMPCQKALTFSLIEQKDWKQIMLREWSKGNNSNQKEHKEPDLLHRP